MNFTIEAIAQTLNGIVEGNASAEVNNISTIEDGKPNTLTFLSNPKYEDHLYTTKATAVIINKDLELKKEVKTTLIRVDNAYQSFAQLMKMVQEYVTPQKCGIEEPHFISKTAKIGKNPYIGAFAYIADNAKIGKNCKIYPHAYIGDNVVIGDNCIIQTGVKICYNTVIGNNCTIQPGAIIGADGFGFAPDENGKFSTIPQLGNVILEDNVDIGANTCIDRATVNSTIIKKGAKIDNLVQLAHNVEVGENTAMAAQTGIAGSVKIGKNNLFGGQAGIAGHLTIGDNNQIGAKAGVFQNINENEKVLGNPAQSAHQTMKNLAMMRRLGEIYKKIRDL